MSVGLYLFTGGRQYTRIPVLPYSHTPVSTGIRMDGNAEITSGVVYVIIFISKKRHQYESVSPPQ